MSFVKTIELKLESKNKKKSSLKSSFKIQHIAVYIDKALTLSNFMIN